MEEKNCCIAILVNSCDAYEEAWPYMFGLLFQYIGENKYISFRVYLNTETKEYCDERVSALHSDKKSWSSRLIDCLEKVSEKYVILLLDDFFIMGNIDTDEIFRVVKCMNNEDVDAVYFKRITGQSSDERIMNRYIEMKPNKKYYMTFQACVWRTDSLIKALIPGLSPWDIEENNKINHNDGLRMLCDTLGSYTDCSTDVIPYLWALESGYGICKSRWLWNNKKLFKKNGLRFKRETLGYMSKSEYLWGKFLRRVFKA